jgi:serpin B
VSEKTKGKIPQLFESPFPPLVVLVLVNTIFFKGSWKDKFNAKKTTNGIFTLLAGEKMPCQLMTKTEKNAAYVEQGGFQCLRLPYDTDGMTATIMLPQKPGAAALTECIEHLTPEAWGEIHTLLTCPGRATVDFTLPRFKLECGGSMNDALQAMGMKEAFDGRGGFLTMSNDPEVHLDLVMHKATLEVDEEGTVAAAATGAVMMTRCMPRPVPVILMDVDRPFVFFLTGSDGSVAFAAKVMTPA